MREITYWLLCGADFCLLTFSILLLFRQKKHDFGKRLLGSVFFILAWYIMMSLLILSGTIMSYPGLFKSGVPFYYLVGPLLYIYVRSACFGEGSFRRYDWIHFVPTLLAFIDLFPYFFLTSEAVKKAELLTYLDDPASILSIGRGFLPPMVHFALRATLGIVYLICQWCLLFGKSTSIRKRLHVSKITKAVSILVGAMYVGNSVLSFGMWRHVGWIDFDNIHSFYDYTALFTIASVVALSIFILDNPSLLYGGAKPQPDSGVRVPVEEEHSTASIDLEYAPELRPGLAPEFIDDFVHRLDDLMKSSQAFRRKGVTVYEIAKDLDVSPTVLSNVLNSHYNQRFNDYINHYRIKYVLAKLHSDEEWRRLSIEGLAEEAGFSSRTPFYAAFKKFTGLTPSLYIKQNIQ